MARITQVIEPMAPADDEAVRELFHACHPGWREMPPLWHFVHPTLIIRDRHRVIASTSFAVSVAPILERERHDDEVLWGRDVCVHPDYRGHKIGYMLCEERLDVGRALGLTFFIGMTWPSNRAMISIFQRQRCTRSKDTIQNAYPDNPPPDRDGVMYTRGL